MKVVVIGAAFPTDHTLARALRERTELTLYGHRLQLRQQTAGPTEPPAGVDARALSPVVLTPRGPMLYVYRGLARALEQDRPDVVHVLLEPWKLVAAQAASWARRHPETVFAVHCGDRNWFRGPLLERTLRRAVARHTLGRADLFVVSHEGSLAEAQSSGLLNGARTEIAATNPRDPEEFRPATDTTELCACRRRLGLPERGIGVGFVTRLDPDKSPLMYLEAVERARLGDGIWAAIAGMGELENEVARRARRQGVSYLGQLEYPGQVAGFLRAVDVVVFPSRRLGRLEEQASRGVIEAMTSGCVVVATRVGALPELVADAGILVEEGDVAALAQGISRAVTETRRAHLRVRARSRAVERYSGVVTADKIVNAWTEALARRRRP